MKLIAFVAITAAVVLVPAAEAQAEQTCLCSVSYVIRPCTGTLTKAGGKTASKRYACHKASTKLQHVKNPSIKVASTAACVAACKQNGQAMLAKIAAGAECKRRPGQHIVTKWNAFSGGAGKNELDIERKGLCPGKNEGADAPSKREAEKQESTGGKTVAECKRKGKVLSIGGNQCKSKCSGPRKTVKNGQCACKPGYKPAGPGKGGCVKK